MGKIKHKTLLEVCVQTFVDYCAYRHYIDYIHRGTRTAVVRGYLMACNREVESVGYNPSNPARSRKRDTSAGAGSPLENASTLIWCVQHQAYVRATFEGS